MLTPGVRSRSILATSTHVELGVLGRSDLLPAHLVDPDGGILMRPGSDPCWGRLLAGEPCPDLNLVASDLTSVPQPDRVRAVVRMRGRVTLLPAPRHCQILGHLGLQPGSGMGRFVPDRVTLSVPGEAELRSVPVPLEEYAGAAADPLAGWEAGWIAHVDVQHAGALRELANNRVHLEDDDVVRALQLDSSGVTLRIYTSRTTRDVRLDFPEPARCPRLAIAAFNALINHSREEL